MVATNQENAQSIENSRPGPKVMEASSENDQKTDRHQPGMSRYEKCSLAISSFGFVLITLSVLATRQQLIQNNNQFRYSMHDRGMTQLFELDRIFIQHPEIRDYLYGGKDLAEDDPLYNRVVAIGAIVNCC
jgi:hypothetical protein